MTASVNSEGNHKLGTHRAIYLFIVFIRLPTIVYPMENLKLYTM